MNIYKLIYKRLIRLLKKKLYQENIYLKDISYIVSNKFSLYSKNIIIYWLYKKLNFQMLNSFKLLKIKEFFLNYIC